MTDPATKLDEVTRVLQGLRPELDELTRARIQARLVHAIEGAQRGEVRAPRRTGRKAYAAGLVAALLAAAAVVLVVRVPSPWDAPQRRTAAPQRSAEPVQSRPALRPTAPAPLELRPYAVAGAGAALWAARLGQPSDGLDLPAGVVVRAAIGERARLSLEGPARLEAIQRAADRIELALDRGALAVEYDGTGGGELVVRTPDARVRVVGTLFGVRVDRGRTRVGVDHGTVEVETEAGRHTLHAEQATESPSGSVVALGDDLRRLLQAHAESLRPPPAEHGLLSVEGPRAGVTARLAGRLLGETPVFALVPVGAVEVSLAEPRGAASVMRTQVAALERSRSPVEPARVARPPSAPAARKPRTATSAEAAPQPAPPAETASLLYQRAERCLALGDRACARRELEALVARYPDSAEAEPALYELAQAAEGCSEAAPWLERYLRRHPNGRFAGGARKRLASCGLPAGNPGQ